MKMLIPKHNRSDFIIGLVVLTFSLALFFYIIPVHVTSWEEQRFSSLYFPQVTAIFMIIVSCIILLQSISGIMSSVRDTPPEYLTIGQFKRVIAAITIVLASYYALIMLGYLVTIFLTVLTWMLLFRERNWKTMLGVSFCTTVLNYYFFEAIMKVNLPGGALIEFLLDRFYY